MTLVLVLFIKYRRNYTSLFNTLVRCILDIVQVADLWD